MQEVAPQVNLILKNFLDDEGLLSYQRVQNQYESDGLAYHKGKMALGGHPFAIKVVCKKHLHFRRLYN